MPEAAATPLLDDDEDATMRDTRIEALLDEWGLPYELDLNFPLSRLKLEPATQIRAKDHQAPTSTVEEYTTHMRHGAVFPPIIVSATNILVDGNTRIAAAQRLARKTFAAYKVKFAQLGQAKMLAAAINQMGGDRLTEDEIVAAAEIMLEAGHGDEAVARWLGRSISHVRNVRKDRTFREAAERTGLANVKLPKQTQRTLASIAHDEPFRAAVEIVAQAKPSTKDVSELVKQIEQTRSDADALAAIQTVAAKWGPVTGPPPRQSLSKSHAKKALRLVNDLLAISENPPDFVMPDNAEAATSWKRLNALSTKVSALYWQDYVATAEPS